MGEKEIGADVPTEVHQRGPRAVQDWLLASSEARPVNEVKLVLVGSGGVGKTSLGRRLGSGRFLDDEPSTHGIEISSLQRRMEGDDFSINLWDFGGQEVMHATHQLFLPRRGVFFIVLDARREESPEYWLRLVRTFGDASPTFVVINKIDQGATYDLNEKYVLSRFPNVSGIYRVSCLSGSGIAALRENLWDVVRTLPFVRTYWPAAWFRVREALEATNRDFLDRDDFVDLCNQQGVTVSEAQNTLLSFLNDLGVIAYFPRVALQVLNPNWVTTAIYRVLNAPSVAAAGGVLDVDLARTVMRGDAHAGPVYRANDRRAILEIMKQFELCYDQGDGTVLVPDLLPRNEPEFDFSFAGSTRVRFAYGFLPRSVVPRLLVRVHEIIDGAVRWRDGAVLCTPGARALIRADLPASAIDVWLVGEERWALLEFIRAHISEINGSLSNVDAAEMVPCPCESCRIAEKPYFYYLSTLVSRLHAGILTVTCERSDTIQELRFVLPSHPLLVGNPRSGAQRVFISYSSKDREVVRRIAADLRAAGVSYWLDCENVRPGDSISFAINRALEESDVLVACVSRNQAGSGWARAEYASALAEFLGEGRKRVIPLIIDDMTVNELPALLRDIRSISYADEGAYESFLRDLSSHPIRS